MTGTDGSRGGSVSPLTALALGTVAFVAVAIFALGVTSLITDQDVIAVEGLTQVPGALGMLLATAAFALTLWTTLRSPRPGYWGALWAALAAALAYLAGVVLGALITGVDLARTLAAVAGLATGWFAPILALAAAVCAWGAIASVRTRAGRPRWPWERNEPD